MELVSFCDLILISLALIEELLHFFLFEFMVPLLSGELSVDRIQFTIVAFLILFDIDIFIGELNSLLLQPRFFKASSVAFFLLLAVFLTLLTSL